jgi:hypothetical protein
MNYSCPMNPRSRKTRIFTSRTALVALFVAVVAIAFGTRTAFMAPGAIWATNVACGGVNINLYASKDDVYLNGGPQGGGGGGLVDGEYYVQVTEPNGTLLGTSIGSADPTPFVVVGGTVSACYKLSDIVIKFSDSSPGYDDTTNGGGEYKVWVRHCCLDLNSNKERPIDQ